MDYIYSKTRTTNPEELIKQYENIYATRDYLQLMKSDLEQKIKDLKDELEGLKRTTGFQTTDPAFNIHGIYHA